MRLSRRAGLVFLAAWLSLIQNESLARGGPFVIQMAFSKPSYLLGEPVWVNVTVRNVTTAPLTVDTGDYCFAFGMRPLSAEVPEAEPGDGSRNGKRTSGGRGGGSCFVEQNRIVLQSDETVNHRYLLEGNFHFTLPGVYQVNLHLGRLAYRTLILDVLPANPAELLTRERELAARIDPHDKEAWQTSYGLSLHPVAGMEPVFREWLSTGWTTSFAAITGLKTLNTPAARGILAEVASGTLGPGGSSGTEWLATDALSESGDQSYAPLMVQLLDSPNHDVRRKAIVGVGRLGGDTQLDRLVTIARTGEGLVMGVYFERQDAIRGIGDSQSRRAVQLLISLFTLAIAADQPTSSDYALKILTHHAMPPLRNGETLKQHQARWQEWWNANQSIAPIYGEFDCASKP
jgi:hypothetical protein